MYKDATLTIIFSHVTQQCLSTTFATGSRTGIAAVTVWVPVREAQFLKFVFPYSSFWRLAYGFPYGYIGSYSTGSRNVDTSLC